MKKKTFKLLLQIFVIFVLVLAIIAVHSRLPVGMAIPIDLLFVVLAFIFFKLISIASEED